LNKLPVWKFRSIEEMNQAVDERQMPLEARLRAVWSWAGAVVPPLGPRGVERYRSVEEADAIRSERERMRSESLRQRRV